ncbi:molybdopterin molybdotransferase MoeA [Pilimelia columellifera]|uniref:molybdopterin molybdotransferase MoeA n=1 Tax=Pilimelia columellifera TaxID=706574 RepID=UPI0031D381B8
MSSLATAADPRPVAGPSSWDQARQLAHAAGQAAAMPVTRLPLARCAGLTLAAPLAAQGNLPAFRTCCMDGWAVRGPGPWRVVGQVLAGASPAALTVDGTAVQVATGAPVPTGATAILRAEDGVLVDDRVHGAPRTRPEWREIGEETRVGELLLPAGVEVTPAVLGLAAASGHDDLPVRPAPSAAVLVFGDELLAAGPPAGGRIRDALGPSVPAWLRWLGARPDQPPQPLPDTFDGHVAALEGALTRADLVCATGGTMRGPADQLRPALLELGAELVVDCVAVRPGHPMLLARLLGPAGMVRFVAGLPGNPQAAVAALVTLVAPLLAGLRGRPLPAARRAALGAPVPGRLGGTALLPVRYDEDGLVRPLPHTGPAMLRGLAEADGYAVLRPGAGTDIGDTVPVLPLPGDGR